MHADGDHWRTHHDALAEVIFTDVRRAGIRGRTEARLLFTDLLPQVVDDEWRRLRTGIIPDALLRTSMPSIDDLVVDRLFDLKTIHYGHTLYPYAHLSGPLAGVGSCAARRSRTVPADYYRAARRLDARFHAVHLDPDTRPVISRLRGYPIHGLCVGAFGETDQALRSLLRATAVSAAHLHWRTAGARSEATALGILTTTYRRRWGAAIALHGARLRISRRSCVQARADVCAAPPGRRGFDPARHAHYAYAEAPIERGPPQGQRG